MEYIQVQGIAKEVIAYIKKVITPGMKLHDIRKICEEKMLELGAESFWYWDIGAFVFAGDETTISVSGKNYKTSDRIIDHNDIVTIDLSPQNNNIWGDYARTVIIENGTVIENINNISNLEWKNGLLMEEMLHEELKKYATTASTFEQVYYHINEFINNKGYINLDFMGNLGHTIVKNKDDRIYIEKENTTKLSEVEFFTFEPHISIAGSKFGYKKENIYYFKDEKLVEL